MVTSLNNIITFVVKFANFNPKIIEAKPKAHPFVVED